MAYKLQTQKIAPGGLNLLPPGDQILDTDCLDLTGCWPGSAGRIEVANADLFLSGSGLTDSCCEAGGVMYSGGGGTFKKSGVNIEAGFDATYPLAMISDQGYVWIINSAKQRKYDGASMTDWVPLPPGAGLTGTNPALTGGAIAITECDPVNLIGTGGAAYYAQINLFTASSIAGMSVGDQVTITGSGAAYNAAWLVKALYPTPGTSLVVLEASLAPGTALAMGGTFSFTHPGMPRDDYDYYITWQLGTLGESNPSPVWHVGVTALGTKVAINRGPIGAAPTGATGWNVYRQSTTMAWPYRVNTSVVDIAATTYDDYGDNCSGPAGAEPQDEEYLTSALSIPLESNHGGPPPARIMANNLFNGRIVVANSAPVVGGAHPQPAYPNRLWYTQSLKPGFFRGIFDIGGDWVDIGNDRSDEIRYIAVKPNQLTVYRAKSIWRVLYDFEDGNSRIEVVVPDLGIVGPQAVASTSLGDYFRGPEGIYKFNGDWAQKVSTKVEPLFRGKAPENFWKETNPAVCALGFENGRLWVSYEQGTGPGGLMAHLCYHTESDRWFRGAAGYQGYCQSAAGLVGAAGGTWLLNKDATTNFVAIQSAYFDCGFPDHEKTWADLVIDHYTEAVDAHVVIRLNKNSDPATTEFTLCSINSWKAGNKTTKQIIPLVYPADYVTVPLRGQPIRSYNLSIRIWGTLPVASVIDTPLLLHYYLEARKGMVFDTDETDHGMPGVVKTVDQVEFDIDATAGPGALQIYADVPGGVMTPQLVAPAVIAQTAGRQSVKIVLNPPIDGKLLRYVATTPTAFQIYNFHARITPIGVYLDGSISETWDTRPIPIAS